MTKRITLLALACLMTVFAASAQSNSKLDLTIGWGGYPMVEQAEYGRMPFAKYDVSLESIGLNTLYRSSYGATKSTGTLTVTLDLPVKKWFSVPFTFAGNLVWQKITDVSDGTAVTVPNGTAQVLAGARFKYMNRKYVNFYSSISIGVGLGTSDYCNEISLDGRTIIREYSHQVDAIPAFQVVPFGVRAGGKVYGIAEIGIGTLYCGGQIGLGIRF